MSDTTKRLADAVESLLGALSGKHDIVTTQESYAALFAYHTEQSSRALPVDEAWLREIGFEPIGKDEPGAYLFRRDCPVAWQGPYGINVGCSTTGWHSCPCETRGDVRDLLSALGIEAKGGGKR